MLKFLTCFVLFASASASTAHGRSTLLSRSSRFARGQQILSRQVSHSAHMGRGGQTPEQLETWKDSGKAVQSSLSDAHLNELASDITTEVYGKQLHEFVDKQFSRFVAHKDNAATAEYVKKQFKEMGLKVSEEIVEDPRIKEQYVNLVASDSDSLNTAKHTNVIGFLKGTDLSHEVVLLGAHYDSVNWEDTEAAAPGVDDNGSGSALMLAIARKLTAAGSKFRPRRSIIFVAFNAEEEGLVGSEHFAKMFTKDGPGRKKYGDLKAVFIADEVAWPGKGADRRKAIFETKGHGDGTTSMIDTLARFAVQKNSTSSVKGDGIGDGKENFVVNYHGFASDHMSFLDNGLPAVLLIERDDDFHAQKWGHSARDTFQHVDLSYGAAMTRLALRAVAAFATPKD